jgi:hypothetical protein
MSVNNLGTFLNIKDSHLRVVSGNVYAQGINIGGITVDVAHGLQSITNQGNVTTNTLQFDNATTAFTTTANATIGRDLTVTGNATVSSNLTVTGNVVISDDLTVTENLLVSNNLTVTGNTFYTNPAAVLVDANVVTEYTGPHDRPLRKYPEVAMTQNDESATSGYVASASSSLTINPAYLAFDATGATSFWHSQYPYYTFVTGTYNPGQASQGTGTPSGTLPTTELISGHQGEWIKLQMPKKIKLEEVRVYASNRAAGTNVYQMPKDIAIAGSNDGTNWYLVDSGTLRTGIRESYGMTSLPVTTSSYYSYLALIVKTIDNQGANYSAIEIANIEYYGHEEGSGSLDTTLKSVYNVPATTGTQLEVYYDGQDYTTMPATVTDKSGNNRTGTPSGGVGFDSTYKAFTFDGSNDYISSPTTATLSNHTASMWIKFDSPAAWEAVYTIKPASGFDRNNFILYVNSTYFRLESSGNTGPYYDINYTFVPGTWVHLTLVFRGTGLEDCELYIDNVRLVPSGDKRSETDDITITGTNTIYVGSDPAGYYLDGSIANFRLYSKALNADQVKELYDYQKDYFLGSKSQVTLYKGHLGVGVTEPSGQLELAGDERIQEYPPRAMTANETLVEGHGVFCASVSSYYTPGGSPFTPFSAFDHNSVSRWATLDTAGYTNGVYTGSDNFTTNGGYVGEWIQLEVPYPIKLRYVSINPGDYANSRSIRAGYILGSTNGVEWNVITNFTGITYSDNTFTTIEAPATSAFHYFRMVVTNVQSTGTMVDITELKFFGTPGPTTLDKGSLTLGRSLDVPRISRYDVDTETPRPEKLVLDFDTTIPPFNNQFFEDKSGRGNDGVYQGAATYSAADKAFTGFPSSSGNYIKATLTGASGAYAHTQSYWINGVDATPRAAFTVGAETGNYSYANIYFYTGSGAGWVLNADGAAGGSWVEDIDDNRWYHIVLTYDGGSSTDSWKFYLDGEYKTPTTGITANAALNLASNPEVRIGRNNGTQWYNGMVSNPKIYSVALEPSEVKKLYRLGRTGRSMILADTSLQIGAGLHDSINTTGGPRATLDVHGSILASSTIHGMSGNFHKMLGYARGGGQADHHRADNCLVAMGGMTVAGSGNINIGFIIRKSSSWMPYFMEVRHTGINTNSGSLFARAYNVYGGINGTSETSTGDDDGVVMSVAARGDDTVLLNVEIDREDRSYGACTVRLVYYYGIKGREY